MNLTDKISNNFRYREVVYSDKAKELRIDNTLPSCYLQNVMNIALYILEPIRLWAKKPFSPLSWYRCQKLNEAVGGSIKSDHMQGMAVDLSIPGTDRMELAKYIMNNLDFKQVIYEGTWVHVSYDKNNNRREVLHKTPNGYIVGLE